MNYSKLPADPSSLVLGIVALVLGFAGCCCYGIFAIIPLIIAIIGLMSANRSLKEFGNNPDVYTPQTRSNVSTARVLNIIAIVFNGIVVLMFIGALIFYGTMWSTGVFDEFKNFDNFETEEIYEYESDTIFSDTEYYESETTIDSIEVEELIEPTDSDE
ncbi:CCC motif membrane protein [Algibacter lectus]|uniref:CCC motif membrane protein n=1 Tax=Algibacter lectus TaxID=221126 RepID=UPI0026E96BF7|nr:CCC motif membrane protein [Algibacter lectus]MDO7136993.1 CCC motif membrane protein [Algibacter lectus]